MTLTSSFDTTLRELRVSIAGLGLAKPVVIIDSAGAEVAFANAANQTATQAAPGADATKAIAVQGVTGGKAVPISAAALPLPAGAATGARQDTMIANQATDLANNPVDAVVSSASVSSAAVGATFSTAGYGSMTFQIVANASGNTVTVEGSNDGGTTWGAISLRFASSAGSAAGIGSSGANSSTAGLTAIPTVIMPQMRWRVSTFVGGTTTIAVGMKRWSFPNVMDVNVGNATLTAAIGSAEAAANVGARFYNDTTTPLTGNATYTGGAHDLAVSSFTGSVAMFGANFIADQIGTAYVDYSTDNATWVTAGSVAVTAGTLAAGPSFDINVRIRARYYRVRFVNGAVAQGLFRVVSSFTAS